MLKRIMGICFFMLMCGSLPAESLWDDTFPGYIAGTSALAVGDIVVVEIDAFISASCAGARGQVHTGPGKLQPKNRTRYPGYANRR